MSIPIVPKDAYFSTTQIKNKFISPEDEPDYEFWVCAEDYETLLNAYNELKNKSNEVSEEQ